MALMHGQLWGVNILLVNVYGPNIDDPAFFADIGRRISEFPKAEIILGGDFNVCLDQVADRKSTVQTRPKQAAGTVLGLMDAERLNDVWRIRHPRARESTFVSAGHGTWSRLDYWLITNEVCVWTTEV